MTKPRVTVADRLSNIIEVVELGRRSGLLTVERGSHQTLEQGEVYFERGRAIYALVEGLRGPDALAVLARWGQCRFAFEPTAPRPTPNIAPPPAASAAPGAYDSGRLSSNPGSGGYQPQRPPPAPPTHPTQPTQTMAARSAPGGFDWDAFNRSMSAPRSPAGQAGAGSPRSPMPPSSPSSFGASWPTSSASSTGQARQPGQAGQAPQSSWPTSAPSSAPDPFAQSSWLTPTNTPTGAFNTSPAPSTSGSLTSGSLTSGSLTSGSLTSGSLTSGSLGGGGGSAPISAQALQRRPRRAPDVRDLIAVVSAYNLSRNHRTILLLADGEHTVLDLTRLSSKPMDEIITLLADLERLGLVYYY